MKCKRNSQECEESQGCNPFMKHSVSNKSSAQFILAQFSPRARQREKDEGEREENMIQKDKEEKKKAGEEREEKAEKDPDSDKEIKGKEEKRGEEGGRRGKKKGKEKT